jgi:hypothetical protein
MFETDKAQEFELNCHIGYCMDNFCRFFNQLEDDKLKFVELDSQNLSLRWEHNFFNGDLEKIQLFINHIKGKSSLDIGCGCIPWTKDTYNVKKQIAIDPLLSQYKNFENKTFGTSFFENFETHSIPAEYCVESLVGKIDGYIMCRNTIDHSEDPLSILNTMSKYAASGCYVLFWADIWHHDGGDVGHHSITKSPEIMDSIFKGLGFKKLVTMNSIRSSDTFIDYGGVFVKE